MQPFDFYLLVYWLDGQPKTIEFTDQTEAIERVKDLAPLMDKVYLFVTDQEGRIEAVQTTGW